LPLRHVSCVSVIVPSQICEHGFAGAWQLVTFAVHCSTQVEAGTGAAPELPELPELLVVVPEPLLLVLLFAESSEEQAASVAAATSRQAERERGASWLAFGADSMRSGFRSATVADPPARRGAAAEPRDRNASWRLRRTPRAARRDRCLERARPR